VRLAPAIRFEVDALSIVTDGPPPTPCLRLGRQGLDIHVDNPILHSRCLRRSLAVGRPLAVGRRQAVRKLARIFHPLLGSAVFEARVLAARPLRTGGADGPLSPNGLEAGEFES
jgi:hypothetical protein